MKYQYLTRNGRDTIQPTSAESPITCYTDEIKKTSQCTSVGSKERAGKTVVMYCFISCKEVTFCLALNAVKCRSWYACSFEGLLVKGERD
jgi:hypothetical protein